MIEAGPSVGSHGTGACGSTVTHRGSTLQIICAAPGAVLCSYHTFRNAAHPSRYEGISSVTLAFMGKAAVGCRPRAVKFPLWRNENPIETSPFSFGADGDLLEY
jgi:hypothetical protein